MLSVKQAAEKLGVSSALVYALVAARKIRHERHGLRRGAIRIPEEALEEYRQRCTVGVEEEIATVAPVAASSPRKGEFVFFPPS